MIAQQVRKTEICDVTKSMLSEWGASLNKAMSECDDLVAGLPTRWAEMEVGSHNASRRTSLLPSLHDHPAAHSIRSPIRTPQEGGPLIPQHHHATISPTQQSSPLFASVGPGSLVGSMMPDTGALSSVLQPNSDAGVERMQHLALSVHMCLDGATRSINAEKASICMPLRGVKEDLRSVCSVGFGTAHHTNKPATTSAEFLCMQSGLMLVCSSGTNPPVELDMRSALAFFQDEVEGGASGSGSSPKRRQSIGEVARFLTRTQSNVPKKAAAMMMLAARKRGVTSTPQALDGSMSTMLDGTANSNAGHHAAGRSGGAHGTSSGPNTNKVDEDAAAAPQTIVTSLKSRYWSKIVCPIRTSNTSPIIGVVTFLNKDKGNNNFSSDDETIVFGVAAALASMLVRCTDVELLSRSFIPNPPVPAFPAHHVAAVTIPGSRSQLVYRTKDPNGGKDIKILLTDGKAERLDNHTSLMAVADYIQRMQQSWKDAVLLNAELRRTHEERTRVVTSLLVRARTSELKNNVLELERVAIVPEDDDHNAKHFRDYSLFLKHRERLEELVREDQKELLVQRQVEERALKERQAERRRKYGNVTGSKHPSTTVSPYNDSINVGRSSSHTAEPSYMEEEEEEELDVYAQSASVLSAPTTAATSSKLPRQSLEGSGGPTWSGGAVDGAGSAASSDSPKSNTPVSPAGYVNDGDTAIGTFDAASDGAPYESPFTVQVDAASPTTDAARDDAGSASNNATSHPPQDDGLPPLLCVGGHDGPPIPTTTATSSARPSPASSTASAGLDPDSMGKQKRDRRQSMLAKQLLFGKEALPPPIVD